MNKKILTVQTLEIYLKKGWTISDFAESYECSEKEFLDMLKKVSKNPNAIQSFMKRLNQNDKKARKTTPNCSQNDEQQKINETSSEETVAEEDDFDDDSSERKLQELEKIEAELKIKIKSKYESKEALNVQISEEKTQIQALDEKIEKLQEEKKKRQETVENLSKEISKVVSEISSKQEQLARVTEEIKELSKIEIFVYENGEIEIDGKEIPETWQEIFDMLTKDDTLEELTLKAIKQLAKTIALYQSLKNEGSKVEVIFANSNMQEMFEKLTK